MSSKVSNIAKNTSYFTLALAVASTFNFCYALYIVSVKLRLKLVAAVDKKLVKSIFIMVVPFALYAIFQRLFTYFDSILLSLLAGDKYVGLYQVAFKFIFALQFLPMAFTASVYPAFSSYWAKNREQLVITFERALTYLIIISLPLTFGIIAISDKLIGLLKPEYLEALPALNIAMIALIFLFVNYPVGALLNACDRQKRNTLNMFITLIVSIILNWSLIPRYQAVGASITVVAANFIMLALGLIVVPQIIPFRPKKVLVVFSKSLAAASVMFASVQFFKSYVNIFLLVGLGGILYILSLLAMSAIRKEDIISIVKSFKNKQVVE